MNKIWMGIVLFVLSFLVVSNSNAQEDLLPGTDIVGRGYDVFGEYASQNSLKAYPIFNFDKMPTKSSTMFSQRYISPKMVMMTNISKHEIKTVSGHSLRDYSKSLAIQAGLEVEAGLFSGSVESAFKS